MNKNIISVVSISVLLSVLLFLPNCGWFGQKNVEAQEEMSGATQEFPDKPSTPTTPSPAAQEKQPVQAAAVESDVLLSIGGKPAMTIKQYEAYLADVLKAQPQFKQLMAFMPDAEQQLYQNYSTEILLEKWVDKSNISSTPQYQEDLKRGQEILKRQLAIKYFQEEYPKKAKLEVTDAQARAAYDENKDSVPQLIVSRGGVNAVGIAFDKQDQAKAFLEKTKSPGAQFDQLAKDEKLTVKQFKNVGVQSTEVDPEIREKLDTAKKFPFTDIIKTKDKFWVIQATGKESTKYVPFEQVKDEIKQQLRLQKLFTEGIEQVKKELGAVENLAYFEKKKKEREKELEKLSQEQAAEEAKTKPASKKDTMKVDVDPTKTKKPSF